MVPTQCRYRCNCRCCLRERFYRACVVVSYAFASTPPPPPPPAVLNIEQQVLFSFGDIHSPLFVALFDEFKDHFVLIFQE